MVKKINFRKQASIAQILILVLGILAVSYALGSEVKTVSGVIPFGDKCKTGTGGMCTTKNEEGKTSLLDDCSAQNGGKCILKGANQYWNQNEDCNIEEDGNKIMYGKISCCHCDGDYPACCIPEGCYDNDKKVSIGSTACGTKEPNKVYKCTKDGWEEEEECSGTCKDGKCDSGKAPSIPCTAKGNKISCEENSICQWCNPTSTDGSFCKDKEECGTKCNAGGGWCLDECDPDQKEDTSINDCPSNANKCCKKTEAPSDKNAAPQQPPGVSAIPKPAESLWGTMAGQYGMSLLASFVGGGEFGTERGQTINAKTCNEDLLNKCGKGVSLDAKNLDATQENCRKGLIEDVTACKSAYADLGKYSGAKLLSGLMAALVSAGIIQAAKAMTDEHDGLYDALTYGVVAGVPLGDFVGGLAGSGWVGMGTTLVVGGMVFLMTYHEEATQKKTFESVVWQPPLGGDHCELCNMQGALPCSEYQCKSLGMACQLINPGTEEEMCFWQNRNDVNPPQIRPWDDALPSDEKYRYIEATNVNPPDKGVKIVYDSGKTTNKNKCLPPYQPITFGVSLDEPGTCKVDYQQKGDYENMTYYFGGDSLLKYNHTQIMTLPGPEETGNTTYNNGESLGMYVRCEDANGNKNTADFVFQFCVDDGPDSTPPIIVSTDPLSGMPVAYNITTLDVNVYTNEKAKCKWSKFDQTYDVMKETMTDSTQWGEKVEMNGITLYKHIATLTGIESDKENKYYFRCIDNAKPVANKNTESYPYTLIGTTPLEIIEIGPNQTIKDNTDTIKVTLTAKTFGGYKEGEATCSFKQHTEEFKKYTTMFSTGTTEHSQDLYLPEGFYNYDIRCVDLGGNADVKNTSFYVDQDTEAPLITRMYYENNYLKLNTNEKATCVYSTTDCTFYYKDGISINAIDDTTFFTDWNTETNLYIKCKDIYGNEPYPPTACTVVARSYDIYVPVEETED